MCARIRETAVLGAGVNPPLTMNPALDPGFRRGDESWCIREAGVTTGAVTAPQPRGPAVPRPRFPASPPVVRTPR
jgi:hypothetical protein